jgi:hypothetical protein
VGVIKKVGWAGFMIGLGLLLDQTFGLFGLDLDIKKDRLFYYPRNHKDQFCNNENCKG